MSSGVSHKGQSFNHLKLNFQTQPTLLPAKEFCAAEDASKLYKAMKGLGTDEDAIIEVLCHRSSKQRMDIIKFYKTNYDANLLNAIRSDTSGDLLKLLIALLTHPSEYCAQEIYDALYGRAVMEDVLIEIMSAKSCYDICEISVSYEKMFNMCLDESLRKRTSGGLRNFLLSLYSANRDQTSAENNVKARAYAVDLKAAGVDRAGNDESVFVRILCRSCGNQLIRIAKEYQNLTGRSLRSDIQAEFSGPIEQALLTVLKVAENTAEFFAERLYKSMKGLGTDDKALVRLVVSRCEIDMANIKSEFQTKYGKSLRSFISGDTSGYYKKALLTLIGEH